MGEIINEPARHIAAQASIDARRTTTVSGNKRRAAETSLANFERSVGNNRLMDSAGRQHDEIVANLSRNLDAAASGKLSQRIRAAEELGATASQAAAAGVGGSSVDVYNETLRLHAAMAEEAGDRQVNSQVIGAGVAAGDSIGNAVASLDNSTNQTNLDFTELIDDRKMGALTRVTALAAAATATYFGGPKAGQAVIQTFGAGQKARNGDIAGASAEMNAAFSNGISGFKTYRAGADDTHSGKAWGSEVFKKVGATFHI